MLPLLAELRTDVRAANKRGAARRTLRLEVHASSSPGTTRVLIRDLSERGLLIETTADLAVGETIKVTLPEAGVSEARIVWTSESFFGCEFLRPVSKAAVSAALLLAPAEQPQPFSPLPQIPAFVRFAAEQVRLHSNPEAIQRPSSQIAVFASLTFLMLVVAMFVFALLALPFST